MSETPEQKAAFDALEEQVAALTPEQQDALEAYLAAHHEEPKTAAEAFALIPAVHAAIKIVAPKPAVANPVRNAAQTVGAVRPLQPLER